MTAGRTSGPLGRTEDSPVADFALDRGASALHPPPRNRRLDRRDESFLRSASFFSQADRHHNASRIDLPQDLIDAQGGLFEAVSMQTAFGSILGGIAKGGAPRDDRILTTSPDVIVSTNLGCWSRHNLISRIAGERHPQGSGNLEHAALDRMAERPATTGLRINERNNPMSPSFRASWVFAYGKLLGWRDVAARRRRIPERPVRHNQNLELCALWPREQTAPPMRRSGHRPHLVRPELVGKSRQPRRPRRE